MLKLIRPTLYLKMLVDMKDPTWFAHLMVMLMSLLEIIPIQYLLTGQ